MSNPHIIIVLVLVLAAFCFGAYEGYKAGFEAGRARGR